MTFPEQDTFWLDVATLLKSHVQPQEQIMAPIEFKERLPNVFPYSLSYEQPLSAFQWIVIHKGMLMDLEEQFLKSVARKYIPVFANEVFVIFSSSSSVSLATGPHVDSFWGMLHIARRLKLGQSVGNQPLKKLIKVLKRLFLGHGEALTPSPIFLVEKGELISRLCTASQLQSPAFLQWVSRVKSSSLDQEGRLLTLHRKLWEYCFICQTLQDSGMLKPGRRGLGFAVGKEPLPACFAGLGCTIVATDLDQEQAQKAGWVDTLQHSSKLDDLYRKELCDPKSFQERVSFRTADMNEIPSDLRDFDFVWSSCAFEHLGSIEQGQRFIYQMINCLKPGGIAIHTTEFNLSSNDDTIDNSGTVLFRRKDIATIVEQLQSDGHYIEVDYATGDQPADQFIDMPPYQTSPHLKLQISKFVTTSIGLIIVKGQA